MNRDKLGRKAEMVKQRDVMELTEEKNRWEDPWQNLNRREVRAANIERVHGVGADT